LEDRDTLSYSLGLSKLYRNGILLEPKVEMEAVRDTWRGKPLNPSFGGKGVLVSYRSRFGFTLDVPLGRGGGVTAAQAGERAALRQAEAALYQQAAALQGTALQTTLTYYNAVAAQERVALLAEAVERERKLKEVAQALVEAEELAPAELTLLSARLAQAESQLAQGRQRLWQARKELAEAIGLASASLEELPQVADALPPPPSEEEMTSWLAEVEEDQAWSRRPEVRASELSQEAASHLAAAAQADLRREVQLSFTFWYNGLHESPKTMAIGRIWPDASKAWGEGFVGPSVALSLNFSLPFANSFARGRLATSLALERQAAVQAGDLRRTIALRAREAWLRLQERRRELGARQQAAAAALASFSAAQELFQAGEVSVIDLIVTEEALISAQLALVDAQLQVAAARAQLAFQLGRLLPVRVVGSSVLVGEG
jgi:outer membrane protein